MIPLIGIRSAACMQAAHSRPLAIADLAASDVGRMFLAGYYRPAGGASMCDNLTARPLAAITECQLLEGREKKEI